MTAAYIVVSLGRIEEVDCFATLGPFGSWQEATSAAGDLEEEFPGGVAYIHRNPHGLISQRTIPEQLAIARTKLAEIRAFSQGGDQ